MKINKKSLTKGLQKMKIYQKLKFTKNMKIYKKNENLQKK